MSARNMALLSLALTVEGGEREPDRQRDEETETQTQGSEPTDTFFTDAPKKAQPTQLQGERGYMRPLPERRGRSNPAPPQSQRLEVVVKSLHIGPKLLILQPADNGTREALDRTQGTSAWRWRLLCRKAALPQLASSSFH